MRVQRRGAEPWGLLKDESGRVCGLWVADLATAKNQMRLRTIIAGEEVLGKRLDETHYAAVATGPFRLETNSAEAGEGYFLFGSSSIERREGPGASSRKWWQFSKSK